mgnify:CR=1 FL=1
MPEIIKDIVHGFVEQTKQLLTIKLFRIILYGSYARGDFCDNSDVDLMILVRDMSEREIRVMEEKLCDIAFEIELDKEIHISVIVKDEIQFESWEDILPFYYNIRKEGIEIFKEEGDVWKIY